MATCVESDHLTICDQLDNLAFQILNVMQNIILERQYLDYNLKEGFINMAKSRYLMSGRKISMLQINTVDLIASKKVSTDLDSVDGVKFNAFHISNYSKVENKTLDDQSYFDASKLNRLKSTNSREDENDTVVENCSDEKKSLTYDNPLRWFGVLVPDTLRICQRRFEQVVETSAKIASLQSQLKALSEEYRRLRRKKSVLSS